MRAGPGFAIMFSMKNIITLFFLSLSLQAMASEPVGAFNNGSLIDPECLQESGEGYMQLYRDVNRIWGTSEMIDMLEKTSSEMNRRFPGKDRLQVEEMSARNGGDIDGHGSHENGLDVDLGYFKANGVEHVPGPGNQHFAAPMVNGTQVSSNFDLERNWELMKSLHRNGRVSRIFVDENLKNAMCRYAKQKGDYSSNQNVLRSMRHVTNHADHMHVRLACPANARRCTDQGQITSGPTGCP